MNHHRMPCRYSTERDLVDRIGGTVCFYMGKPVRVQVESTDELILTHPITRKLVDKIRPDDENFDISSPELGYVNFFLETSRYSTEPVAKVLYAYRPPVRRYRQGICEGNVYYLTIDGTKWTGIPGILNAPAVFDTNSFVDMLQDEYPTIEQAFEMMELPLWKEVAVSKDVAIQKTASGVFQVYYKGQNVGFVIPGTRTCVVPSNEMGWIVSKFIRHLSWKVE